MLAGWTAKRITIGGVILMAAYHFTLAFNWKAFGDLLLDILKSFKEQNGALATVGLLMIAVAFGGSYWVVRLVLNRLVAEIDRHVAEKRELWKMLGVDPPSSKRSQGGNE